MLLKFAFGGQISLKFAFGGQILLKLAFGGHILLKFVAGGQILVEMLPTDLKHQLDKGDGGGKNSGMRMCFFHPFQRGILNGCSWICSSTDM